MEWKWKRKRMRKGNGVEKCKREGDGVEERKGKERMVRVVGVRSATPLSLTLCCSIDLSCEMAEHLSVFSFIPPVILFMRFSAVRMVQCSKARLYLSFSIPKHV